MVHKNQNTISSLIENTAENTGLAVMAMASFFVSTHVVLEMVGHRAASHVPHAPVPAYATVSVSTSSSDDMRRSGSREEIRHTSASYGASMRSHPTAGSI